MTTARRQFKRADLGRRIASARRRAAARARRLQEPVYVIRHRAALVALTEREALRAGLLDAAPTLALCYP